MMLQSPSQPGSRERGSAIIEALCAIVVLAIGIAGSISLYTVSLQSLESTRSFTTLSNDAQRIFEDLRTSSFNSVLDNFGASYTSIADGQTTTITPTTISDRADYTVTLTAIKSADQSTPDAVRVTVESTQRRGKLGNHDLRFDTVIARG